MRKNKLPTLLIITDDPSVCFWLKKHLNKHFFLIDVETKTKALEIIRNTNLDFIAIDSCIEGSDPIELCRSIRKAATATPILLITGRLSKTYLKKALEAGATDFLNNHLDVDELKTKIATFHQAVLLREKTEGLASLAISIPKKQSTNARLKKKIFFQTQALHLLTAAKEKNTPLNLLVLRIDEFDPLKHRKEDVFVEELLLKLNKFLKSYLNESDLSIPSSDGKFILLTNSAPKPLAESLRKKIKNKSFTIDGEEIHITASFAISPIEASEESLNQIVKTATKALKQSQSKINQIISIDKEFS